MEYGTVKWWNSSKGFGFIITENENEDELFVHVSDFYSTTKSLREGQKVEFDIRQDMKGAKAVNVRGL